ncbi:hypothetical protein FDP41_004844 [Naegleria fowleri]|uniref:mitogen-activated protein kinase kinase n=1 Tax=Naegleria fowleri TaxID=5763 RepID=A0A6A5BTC3_NAEFO|nr:uncharacterized protein FDP41_004844 [Naegleria fowleri]KAF0976169.1 hypothetical protein FDP41_004844 [Naegleria fowleri]
MVRPSHQHKSSSESNGKIIPCHHQHSSDIGFMDVFGPVIVHREPKEPFHFNNNNNSLPSQRNTDTERTNINSSRNHKKKLRGGNNEKHHRQHHHGKKNEVLNEFCHDFAGKPRGGNNEKHHGQKHDKIHSKTMSDTTKFVASDDLFSVPNIGGATRVKSVDECSRDKRASIIMDDSLWSFPGEIHTLPHAGGDSDDDYEDEEISNGVPITASRTNNSSSNPLGIEENSKISSSCTPPSSCSPLFQFMMQQQMQRLRNNQTALTSKRSSNSNNIFSKHGNTKQHSKINDKLQQHEDEDFEDVEEEPSSNVFIEHGSTSSSPPVPIIPRFHQKSSRRFSDAHKLVALTENSNTQRISKNNISLRRSRSYGGTLSNYNKTKKQYGNRKLDENTLSKFNKHKKRGKNKHREQHMKKMERSRAVPGMVLSGEESDMATNEIIFDPAFKSSSYEEDIFDSSRNKNNKTDTCSYNNMYDEPITPNKRHVVQDDDFFAIPKQEEHSIEKEDHTSKPSRNRSSSTLSNTSSCSNISLDGMRPTAIIEFQRCSTSSTTTDTTSIPSRSQSFSTSVITSDKEEDQFNTSNISGLQGDDIFDAIPSVSSTLYNDDEGLQSDSIFDLPHSTFEHKEQVKVMSSVSMLPSMAHEDTNNTPKKASDTTKTKKPKKDKKKHMVGNLMLNLSTQNEEETPRLVKTEKDVRDSVRNIVQPKITESGSFMLSDRYKANQDGTQRNEISPESAQLTIDSAQSFINAFNILSLNSTKGPFLQRPNQPPNNSESEAQRLRQALSGNTSIAPPVMATVNSFKMPVNSAVLSTSKSVKTEKKKRTLKRFNNEDFTWKDLIMLNNLGSGFSSQVIKCSNSKTGKHYALKKIDLSMNDTKNSSKMIITEFNCLAECRDCPYIVRIVDIYHFKEEKELFLLLEFMDKGTLKDVIEKTKGSVSEEFISLAACQLLLGLAYAHEKQIIHRDIKPENILLNSEGYVKLADWGMSCIMRNKSHTHTHLGTEVYMSPERRVSSDNKHSYPCDIYALGLSLLELALGRVPILQVWDFNDLYRKQTSEGSFWLDAFIPFSQFSDEFSQFLKACLEKDPESRMSCSQLLRLPFITRYNGHNEKEWGGERDRLTVLEFLNG